MTFIVRRHQADKLNLMSILYDNEGNYLKRQWRPCLTLSPTLSLSLTLYYTSKWRPLENKNNKNNIHLMKLWPRCRKYLADTQVHAQLTPSSTSNGNGNTTQHNRLWELLRQDNIVLATLTLSNDTLDFVGTGHFVVFNGGIVFFFLSLM